MAKKKRRKTRSKKKPQVPGWIYLLMGLSVGLAVAFAIYMSDRQKIQPAEQVPVTTREPASSVPQSVEIIPESDEITFDFYDLLPSLDVEVYEEEKKPARKVKVIPKKVRSPGIYILQAGSFSRLEDANRRKAQIALLGVRSEIKKGKVNGKTVFRVYTGPMEQPADVNRTSDILVGNGIEILLKRVSD
jgi:cell division protein FtsN